MANRKWINNLVANETALSRLESLLDRTLNNEDTSMFPSVEDAAEVFAIVWMAYTSGEILDDQVANTELGQRLITNVAIGTAEIDEERDEFRFYATCHGWDMHLEIDTQ